MKTQAPHNQELEQRLCEATMAILQNVPSHRLNIVMINKALFYADLHALRDFGQTITASSYLALKQGPVVANYPKRVVDALQERGWARQIEEGLSKPLSVCTELTEFPSLTPEQLKILASIAKGISDKTSSGVSRISHGNLAWKKAFESGQGIGRPAVKLNMMLAMQQLPVDDDGWLNAEATEAEKAAVANASSASEEWV